MRIDYINATRYTPFLPSGTNPLYTEPEKIKPERKIRVEPVGKVEQTNHTRDTTIETRERGRSIDIFV